MLFGYWKRLETVPMRFKSNCYLIPAVYRETGANKENNLWLQHLSFLLSKAIIRTIAHVYLSCQKEHRYRQMPKYTYSCEPTSRKDS